MDCWRPILSSCRARSSTRLGSSYILHDSFSHVDCEHFLASSQPTAETADKFVEHSPAPGVGAHLFVHDDPGFEIGSEVSQAGNCARSERKGAASLPAGALSSQAIKRTRLSPRSGKRPCSDVLLTKPRLFLNIANICQVAP